ncbi:MAG: DegV family protein [Candidatus Flexifilum sp.]|jgi:DegV family protein with EDD domain
MALKKIRFVTDSTCDVPPELVAKYGIGVVPCYINYNNTSYADDGKELVREEYYNKLSTLRPFPTTSAMPPSVAEAVIRSVAEDADHVIIIGVSTKLSGVLNAMRLGAQNCLPPDRYTIVDSEQVTMGLGWQVIIGAETAEKTGDVQQTLEAIASVRSRARVYAALSTLEFLHRSGRVGWAAAGIGQLLQIKPLIAVVDGEVQSVARVRTFSRALEELIRITHTETPLERLAVLYASDYEAAVSLKERLRDIAPADTLITSITPTVGTHIGPGGLGVATVRAAKA